MIVKSSVISSQVDLHARFGGVVVAFAETLAAFDIFVGVNAVDYSGYPDCRPEFIAAYSNSSTVSSAKGTTSLRRPMARC